MGKRTVGLRKLKIEMYQEKSAAGSDCLEKTKQKSR